MKKLIIILGFILIATPADAVFKYPYWQSAGWGGGGQYVMPMPDYEIPNRVYLLSDVTGQWFSNDGGDTWEWMNEGADAFRSAKGASIMQDPNNPNTLWQLGEYMLKSTDRGGTWVGKDNSNATRPNVHESIAINPNDSNDVLYGENSGDIRRTTDGGETWSDYDTMDGTVYYLMFSPDGSRLVASATTDGFGYYDIDGTDTFTNFTITGTNSSYTRDTCNYTRNVTDFMCVTSGHRVACSSDQGDTWNYTTAVSINDTSYIWRLDCTVDSGNNVRYAVSTREISDSYTGSFFVSADSGSSWTEANSNFTEDAVNNPTRAWYTGKNPARGIRYDPFDADIIYRNDDWGVWKTTDHGANWTEKIVGAQMGVITDLALSPNDRLFATAMDNGVLYSDDWGDTWTMAFPDGVTYDFDEAGHMWSVVTTGTLGEWNGSTGRVIATSTYWSDFKPRVMYSEDNGDTWTVTTSGLPDAKQLNGNWGTGYNRSLTYDPQDDSIIYMGLDGWTDTMDGSADDGGVFKSTDGGEVWSRVSQPPNWQIYNCLEVSPLDQDTFYFGTFGSSAYNTVDAGSNYTQVTSIPYVYDCLADASGKIYVAGNSSGPYLSRGSSFTSNLTKILDPAGITGDAMDGLAINPDDTNQLVTGMVGRPKVYITYDLTASTIVFEDLALNAPFVDGIHDYLFAPNCGTDGCLFAAGNGSGVLKLDLQPDDGVTVEGVTIEGVGFNN